MDMTRVTERLVREGIVVLNRADIIEVNAVGQIGCDLHRAFVAGRADAGSFVGQAEGDRAARGDRADVRISGFDRAAGDRDIRIGIQFGNVDGSVADRQRTAGVDDGVHHRTVDIDIA